MTAVVLGIIGCEAGDPPPPLVVAVGGPSMVPTLYPAALWGRCERCHRRERISPAAAEPHHRCLQCRGNLAIVDRSSADTVTIGSGGGVPRAGDVVLLKGPDGLPTLKRILAEPGDRIELCGMDLSVNGQLPDFATVVLPPPKILVFRGRAADWQRHPLRPDDGHPVADVDHFQPHLARPWYPSGRPIVSKLGDGRIEVHRRVRYRLRRRDAVDRYPLTLPDGQWFVVGDNVPVSIDSRTYGPIAGDSILGIVIGRSSPIGQ